MYTKIVLMNFISMIQKLNFDFSRKLKDALFYCAILFVISQKLIGFRIFSSYILTNIFVRINYIFDFISKFFFKFS